MKNLLIGLMTVAVVSAIGLSDAQAKRVGSGRDVGRQAPSGTMQRDATPGGPTATPATPASPAASPQAAPARAATPAQAPQAAPQRNKWLGPIAGLAAGLGLAALASHLGFGEELASFLMIGLLVMVVLAVVGFIMARRRAAAGGQPAYAGAGAGNYGNAPIGQEASVPPSATGATGTRYAAFDDAPQGGGGGSFAGSAPVAAASPAVPAGFDVDGFLRTAKVCFIRMQASYDAGNLQDLREFTSPEMFAELKLEIEDRKGAANQTDVTTLDAGLLAVQRVDNDDMASVRFSGMIREQADAPAESFDEVWNFARPVSGQGGWVLVGIQQITRG
jgi:predicted lipid-binding transport protein (Tim44 family)